MKSIAELYHEVMASEELKKEFFALKPEEVEGFAERHGCKATLDEIRAYIMELHSASGELSDEELNQVAGGSEQSGTNWWPPVGSGKPGTNWWPPAGSENPDTNWYPPTPDKLTDM